MEKNIIVKLLLSRNAYQESVAEAIDYIKNKDKSLAEWLSKELKEK
ncbi:MAG: hypothetical protein HUJ63_06855 [Enterococcus sp.]|nr:hypothetical protein [Enterococcus sp.]